MSEKVILEDLLKSYQDDTILHIGSQISFLFVGTKKEFLAEEEKVNSHLIKKTWKRINDYHKSISARVDIISKGRITISDRRTKLERTKNELTYLKKYFDYIEKFIPIRKRPVKKEYERLQGDGLIIIIDGDEVGEFWDREEYLRKEW